MRWLSAVLLLALAACFAFGQCWGASMRPAVAGPRFVLRPAVVRPAACPCPKPCCGAYPCDCILGKPCTCRARGGQEARPEQPKRPQPPARKLCPCDPEGDCGCLAGGLCECGRPKRPARPARPAPPDQDDELPTGVDRSRLGTSPRYTIGGKEVTRAEAVRSIGQLADDSAKPRLTLFGGDGRKALRAAIMADPAIASAVLCQDYASGHWAVAKHPPVGEVSVYLQKPTGETLWKGAGLDPAAILKAIKQALGLVPPDQPAPSPVPSPTPGPTPAAPDLAGWWKKLNDDAGKNPLLLLGGAALALYLLNKK